MDIATVSVVSSSVVALATIAATVVAGAWQRRHERLLAFEDRAWRSKSEALLKAIGVALGLRNIMGVGHDAPSQALFVLNLGNARAMLLEPAPVIEAHGSEAARRDLKELVAQVGNLDAIDWRQKVLAAVPGFDRESDSIADAAVVKVAFDRAAEVHAAGTSLESQLRVDREKIDAAAARLIDSARADLRSDR